MVGAVIALESEWPVIEEMAAPYLEAASAELAPYYNAAVTDLAPAGTFLADKAGVAWDAAGNAASNMWDKMESVADSFSEKVCDRTGYMCSSKIGDKPPRVEKIDPMQPSQNQPQPGGGGGGSGGGGTGGGGSGGGGTGGGGSGGGSGQPPPDKYIPPNNGPSLDKLIGGKGYKNTL